MNLAPLVAALALTAAAGAGPVLDAAAAQLRRDPVYVAPDADPARTLSDADASRIRERIETGSRPVFVAVLPSAAADEAGGIDRLPPALGEATGLTGTFAVVTPQGFRAASNDLPAGLAPSVATSAFQAEGDNGVAAVLEEFVSRLEAEAPRDGSTGGSFGGEGRASDGGGGGSSALPLLLVGGAVGGGVYLMGKKRR